MEFNLQEELKNLPDAPGVYLMHDAKDTIIYVGKAVVLKNRVRQYFQKGGNKSPKVQRMVSQIAWFETIVVDSEAEALVLECNLIKEHRPKYNTMLKDDKSYPYIRVTVEEEFPRVLLARRTKKDTSKYYGPYVNAGAVRDTIRLTHRLFRIRDCSRKLPEDIGKERPCLNYHIHQCDAPCQGWITAGEYAQSVEKAQRFLEGEYAPLLTQLQDKMQEAADRLDFEEAAKYRELLFSVRKMDESQKMVESHPDNRDILALAVEGKDAIVQVFFVREGKLIGRDHFHVLVAEGDENAEILENFVKQFYAGAPFVPREILLPERVADEEAITNWLSLKSGHRVALAVPKRGEKHRLMELAENNAALILQKDREKVKREEARTRGAVRELEGILGLTGLIRMEAFDISNTSGFESVGSMVVYENGKPKKNDYRKFKVKWVKGANDPASMEEVLTRRFVHGLEEQDLLRENGMEEKYGSFNRFPDLILIDGGRGQVHAAQNTLEKLHLQIPVCGMVKDDNHRTRALFFGDREVEMDRESEAFALITRIQDEVHRFAVEYHRSLRGKAQVHSVLDEIDGVGPARRKSLMRQFRTIEAIRDASVEDLAKIPSMNHSAARTVYAFFHEGEIPE